MQITFEEMLLLQASWCFLLVHSGLDTGSSGSGSGRAGVFGSVGVLGLCRSDMRSSFLTTQSTTAQQSELNS